MKPVLKTPISYYGGKQNLLTTILPIIQPHNLYCEPFCGGAAVFWGKEPSAVEVINDLNSEVVNFYQMMQLKFEELYTLIDATLHSRKLHSDADIIYKHPHMFTDVERAWAFWVQCKQSFSSTIGAGWAYARKKSSCEKKLHNNKLRFKDVFKERLKYVQIECNNAIKVIKSRDTEDTFFYVDPPYPNAHQGHYTGYSMDDFKELLEVLKNIRGKFLLSSYDYEELTMEAYKNNWVQHKKEMIITATVAQRGVKRDKKKIEVFTANYDFEI